MFSEQAFGFLPVIFVITISLDYMQNNLIIVRCGLVILLGFSGFLPILKEHRIGLRVLAILWIIINIMHIATFAWTIAIHPESSEYDETFHNLTKVFSHFGSGVFKEDQAVNIIQRSYACCGVDDFRDWASYSPWNYKYAGSVPDSCCMETWYLCGSGGLHYTDNINTRGCLKATVGVLDSATTLVIMICYGSFAILIQLANMILFFKFSMMVGKSSINAETHQSEST